VDTAAIVRSILDIGVEALRLSWLSGREGGSLSRSGTNVDSPEATASMVDCSLSKAWMSVV
jgi:hypothetical protein